LLSCNQKKTNRKKGKGIKAMQQKWQQEMHGEQNKRIKAAATINWKGTTPPPGKMCGK